MKVLFVDTAGWMACADASDPGHRGAVAARDGWLDNGGVLMTTDYVVDETLTLIRIRLGLDAARKWWQGVSASPRVRMVEVDGETRDAARSWFFRYGDKLFSFTDCTSFAVMRKERLRKALTTDRHFRQAGFLSVPS